MSVASFDAGAATMTWVGVGNVSGLLISEAGSDRDNRVLISRGGVVGHNLPPVRPTVHPLERGDTLVLATDGILDAYAQDLSTVDEGTQRTADRILARYGKHDDDALVLVARCLVPR